MLRSLYSGASGMRSHQTRLDVIGNNIANVNTTGFKSGRAEFKDTLSQTLKGGSARTNPIQIGTGVSVATIFNDMGQGALQMTNRSLDVAIEGSGFFHVKDSAGTDYYTRNGCFFVTESGELVNSQGYIVCDNAGNQITVNIPIESISIAQDGTLTVNGSNAGTIGIALFNNPNGLKKVGNNLFKETTASGSATHAQPGTNGAGTLAPGYLEMSNVDLTKEFTDMIITQRGFQANARTITVSDTILEELINLKR